MKYEEFMRQLGKAGISAREFAELTKANANAVRNYKQKGEVPSHLAVIATLMGEMAEHSLDFKTPLSKICIVAKQPRGVGFMKKPD